jgi:hypothetical protein
MFQRWKVFGMRRRRRRRRRRSKANQIGGAKELGLPLEAMPTMAGHGY